MKNKFLLALASLIVGLAAFSANAAYADSMGAQTRTQSNFCSSEGWNIFDPNCGHSNAMTTDREREGKAAYGEPREEKMAPVDKPLNFCSSQGPTIFDRNCAGDMSK